MKTVNFPKIKQFREVVSVMNNMATFIGMDKDNNPIYDKNIKKDVKKIKGTVKLHGTNAGISYNTVDGIYAQSKNESFKLEELDSHMGFTFFVKKNESIFQSFFDKICEKHNIDTNIFTITIYGEWCGIGIQKNVAISKMEKSFFIFGIKISNPNDENVKSYWIDYSDYRNNDNRIYNIDDFETFEVEVDFNVPQLSQNKFVELTEYVENQCPVGKAFGIEGIGEGIVWSFEHKGHTHRFKTKGDKHSVSKVKKVASVDVEKINSIIEFVDYAVTKNRFEQGLQEVYGHNMNDLDITKIGDLLRWVIKDIMEEEMDTMVKNNLEPKDVNKYISNKTREMFFEKYNNF